MTATATKPSNTRQSGEPGPLSEDAKDEVVTLYRRGTKLDEITRITGVKRPTIFYVLSTRGITPSRQRASRSEVTVDSVLQELNAAQRTIGRLEAELELCKAELDQLRARSTTRKRG